MPNYQILGKVVPEKGVDYWTEEEKEEMIQAVVDGVEDKKQEYITNANTYVEQLTTLVNSQKESYNTNATNKTSDFNSLVTTSKGEIQTASTTAQNELNDLKDDVITSINTNLSQKLDVFNTNASSKVEVFNNNAANQTLEFTQNVTTKEAEYNTNAITKTSAFDSNVVTKTNDFNTNATNKLSAYNTNADNKISDYNSNAETKLDDYNTNSETKLNEYNTNAQAKLDAYDLNAESKLEEYNAIVASIDARIEELEADVDKIETTRGHVYGVRRKLSNNTAVAWERIEDSIGLVANATKNGGTVRNDFDNLAPWKDIISFNLDLETGKKKAYYGDADFAFDGSNGDVYTHIPTFWIKIYEENDYMYILIADYAKSGFTEIKEFDIARYLTGIGTDNKLHSYSGIPGAGFKNINQYRTLAKQLGDDYCLMDWRYFAIQCLFLVEFATFNSQDALGKGMELMRHNNGDVALVAETNTNRIVINTSGGNAFIVGQQIRIGAYENTSCALRTITAINNFEDGNITGKEIVFDGDPIANITLITTVWSGVQNAGGCDALGMKSGCLVNDSKHNVAYRGIEGLFGNIYSFVDGINIKDRKAYICYNPTEYTSDKFTEPYEPLGYTNATTNGYPKRLGHDINHPLIQFPTEIGGSTTSGTSDYYYQDAGNRVARVGGTLLYGARCGLWGWNLIGDSPIAAWGCGARVLKYQ